MKNDDDGQNDHVTLCTHDESSQVAAQRDCSLV